MHHILVIAASFASLSVASPVEPRGKKTFTIPQVLAKKQPGAKAPAVSMMKTYSKYSSVGAVAPAAVKVAASAAQSGTVTATPESFDEAYLCPVTVGGQVLNMDFDTGSADLWVYSTLMATSDQTGHDIYDPTSTGSLLSGQSWSLRYGDGSQAGGVVYADTVKIGSATATSQAVEAATSVSSQFLADTSNDGLLGLAFSSINTVRPNAQSTFFDTVKSSLAQPLFTVDLKKGEAGSFDFGFINASKYTGSITYVDVDNSNGFWGFTPTGYAIGTGATVSTSYSTIADTGTTLMYLPIDVVTAYYNAITGSSFDTSFGGYVFPCNATLPGFTTVIGGKTFTVPGSYINYAQISDTVCFGGIQSDAGIGFSIFGDIFLKSQFVVFSQINSTPQLGFAAQNLLVDDDEDELEYYECADGESD